MNVIEFALSRRSAIGFVLVAFAVSGASACACSKKDTAAASTASGVSAPNAPSGSTPAERDGGADAPSSGSGSSSEDVWLAASSLAPEDLGRLALREGSVGMVAGAMTPERRRVTVHALAFAEDLEALPFLGEISAGPDPELALVAAESANALAARPRRSVDPEDAIEVREGCDRLRAVAATKEKPKTLRVKIVRALAMLGDRGCARDLPTVE